MDYFINFVKIYISYIEIKFTPPPIVLLTHKNY